MIYIDRSSKIPIYQQIYKKIQTDILNRELLPGTVLQGCRLLAKDLGIGRNTVEHAYTKLAEEGFIIAQKGIGYIVQTINDCKLETSSVPPTYELFPPQKNFLYDLSCGNFSHKHFPHKLWTSYTKHCIRENTYTTINHYQDKQGYLPLRNQLKHYLHRTRGVTCSENQIIITAGLQHALDIVSKLFPPNASFAMEEPGYFGALAVFQNNHNNVRGIPIDNEGLIVNHLNQYDDIQMLLVTPSHQFPTGYTMSLQRRQELLEWSKKKHAFILEDDLDCEYQYNEPLLPSIQSMDKDDRVIYYGTFSRSISPSLRISYLILPKQLITIYAEQFKYYNCAVPLLHQFILTKLFEDQHYPRLIRMLKRRLNIQYLITFDTFCSLMKGFTILNP